MLELELYMAKARMDARYETDPMFYEQLERRHESLLACLIELEVHDTQGNDEKYEEAYNRAQECLDQFAALVG